MQGFEGVGGNCSHFFFAQRWIRHSIAALGPTRFKNRNIPSMKSIDRRTFLKATTLATAALSAPGTYGLAQVVQNRVPSTAASSGDPWIVDTNVNVLGWPFRHLKYGETGALVAKLKKHRVREAWAGTYEALFHKDIDGLNTRLVEECRRHGDGMLVPFGSVNLVWPTWEKRLQICHEVHRMPGVRIYPGYQPFDFDHPDFPRLLRAVAERNLILQISLQMEDPRVHHPVVQIGTRKSGLLLNLLREVPHAKIQLLHWGQDSTMRGRNFLPRLLAAANVFLDISNLEATEGLGRMFAGNHWEIEGKFPVERFLFGSLTPYFPLECAMLKLFESTLTREQMAAVMEGNAHRLRA